MNALNSTPSVRLHTAHELHGPTTLPRSSIDTHALLLARLGELLAEAGPSPVDVLVRTEDAVARLTVVPAAPQAGRDVGDLSPCERDAYLILLGSPRPLTKSRIQAALEARGIVYGDSTLEHALPRLRDRGWIRNRKSSPRGYTVVAEQEARP